jgi:Na+/proline symporter
MDEQQIVNLSEDAPLEYAVAAFILYLLVTWIVSLFTKPAPETEKAFEEMFD